ncbi:MAG: hypothetical protein AAF823_05645 [Planctomycetota bacterium]
MFGTALPRSLWPTPAWAVVSACVVVGGVARAAAISELFVDTGGASGAVELHLATPGDRQAASGGVTMIAAAAEGPLSGLVLGSWFVPVGGEAYVLLHETPMASLPGYLEPVTGATAEAEVGSWDRVAFAAFAGDVRGLVSSPLATLSSTSTQLQLGAAGLLAAVTVTPSGTTGWAPDAAAIGFMGGEAGDWAVAVTSGDGVYRPWLGGEWVGGVPGAADQVVGPGYSFRPTPGRLNLEGQVAVLPEPGWLSAASMAGVATLRRRVRSRR